MKLHREMIQDWKRNCGDDIEGNEENKTYRMRNDNAACKGKLVCLFIGCILQGTWML